MGNALFTILVERRNFINCEQDNMFCFVLFLNKDITIVLLFTTIPITVCANGVQVFPIL